MSGRVLLLTDAGSDRHVMPGHVERPERRRAVVEGIRAAGGDALEERASTPAADDLLARAHDGVWLATLEQAERRGGGWLDPDTYVVVGSFDAARHAAGATATAALSVASGDVEVAFAAVRPPGHHAARDRGTGFCLLNNVAVAVEALRSTGAAQRVAIVDWDVHHGDGTQSIFDADPDLCYASTHQAPLYPGTGAAWETGGGAGVGTMHNHPLVPGSGDDAFVAAWRDELLPALASFGPQALLVSAGYDAHRADPLASLEVTEAGYEAVARMVGSFAARSSLPGVALTLEGGYDLDALRGSAAATVRGLLAGMAEPESG